MKIYVASSWRNKIQPEVVALLKACGHDVYDFRHPAPGNEGFAWSSIDPDWLAWDPMRFRECLTHPTSIEGFRLDMTALRECQVCLLVLPCGRSAHLELGQACGAGKKTAVYMPEPSEPELMYKMVDKILVDQNELSTWAERLSWAKNG